MLQDLPVREEVAAMVGFRTQREREREREIKVALCNN